MLRSSNQQHKQENQVLQAAVSRLTKQVNCLKQQLYGTKSEQAEFISIPVVDDEGEKDTPDESQKPQEKSAPEKEKEKSSPKKAHKRKLLIRTDKVLEHLVIPEEVKQNPNTYRQLPESMDKSHIAWKWCPVIWNCIVTVAPALCASMRGNPNPPKLSTRRHRQAF